MDKKRKHCGCKTTNDDKPKTDLQEQQQQRKTNRQTANKLAETAKRQLLVKYPPQESVLTAPRFQGLHFPLKQETERMVQREKANALINKILKDLEEQSKTKLWQRNEKGVWQKRNKNNK
jgi:hypothetical protein